MSSIFERRAVVREGAGVLGIRGFIKENRKRNEQSITISTDLKT